jgi:histidyl-tRNA synthetase
VVVTVMDRDRMADYQAMVGELRAAGIRAEVYLGNPKNFGNQMKYADRRGSPVAIIEGGDEKARGVVQIKDLILGAQLAQNATLEEWKDRPSQYEVPRGQLIEKVREILAGQG